MPIIDVAAALVFRDGKVLITQRHADAHLGGLWEFPGGKREPNEAFEACLQRELREELGIEVAVGELVESLTHAYPEKTVHLKFYRCRWTKHEPQPLGCSAFKWVSGWGAKGLRLSRRRRSAAGEANEGYSALGVARWQAGRLPHYTFP